MNETRTGAGDSGDLTRRMALKAAALSAGALLAPAVVGRAAELPPDTDDVDPPVQNKEFHDAKGKEKGEELEPFRFDMEAGVGKDREGCTAREATAVNFPISKGIAGVSMRLAPGAMREPHWHANAAEWAYVVKGYVRTTVFDPVNRTSEENEFGPGDVWYFPRGHGHMLQGMGSEQCHFILGFDNGYFSENGTFSITDWLGHIPPDVLAKNLKVPPAAFKDFPRVEMYFSKGRVPERGPLRAPPASQHIGPATHKYALRAQVPAEFEGGTERLVSSLEFPISKTMSGVLLTLKPGALRELHWHANADEWFYVIQGDIRATAFGSHARVRTETFRQGDVGYVPQGFGHHLENVGNEEAELIVIFNNGIYTETSLTEWLTSNPLDVVADTFGIPDSLARQFPKKPLFIAGPSGQPST